MAVAKLNVVETDLPVRVMSVFEASESGNRRDELVAMRRRIARALDDEGTSARDLASLSRRHIEISREIEALDLRELEEGSGVVETADEKWESV